MPDSLTYIYRLRPDRTGPDLVEMKTYTAKNETVRRDWYVVDAAGKTLGRLATEIARRLRGKPVITSSL